MEEAGGPTPACLPAKVVWSPTATFLHWRPGGFSLAPFWAPMGGRGCREVASAPEDSASSALREAAPCPLPRRPGPAASAAQDPKGQSRWLFPVPFISVL